MSRRRLTVLAWEGPQARAYLVRMARAGIRPDHILLIVRDRFLIRPFGAVALTSGFGLRWAERRQDLAHNHHPYRIRQRHGTLMDAITTGLAGHVDTPARWLDEMYRSFVYERYADRVTRLPVSGLRDARLSEALRGQDAPVVLFTGGGLVPASLLAVPGVRLLHVHAGLLPHVRGADVLLWSLLVRGRPGLSAFFLSAGLDEGDVLAAADTPVLQIPLQAGHGIDDEALYRAVFSFIDPVLRAEFLVTRVLQAADDPAAMARPQSLTSGVTFHFMHPALRRRALARLFPS